MEAMASHQIIEEWLNCGTYSQQELELIGKNQLLEAIIAYLEHLKSDDKLLDAICNKLYSYYRSNDDRMVRFCLSFIPTLIGVHIMNANNCLANESPKYGCIDILLLGVYNLEVVDSDGQLVERTFRLMSISKPSVYHEPSPHSAAQNQSMLTEHNISKLDNFSGDINVPIFGPYLEVEELVANNRLDVMTVLMKVYNQNISSVCKQSLTALCRMCLRLLRQGSINISAEKLSQMAFNLNALLDSHQSIGRNSTKIVLSSQFLVELTHSVYFCIFNGVTDIGFEALEEIHIRAVNNLYTDVLLMTNAIQNSLLINSGQPSDGPMGINVALSPTATTSSSTAGISKIAITNASFRTRKLPDDIPIVVAANNSSNPGSNQMGTISEENEESNEKSKEGKTGAIKGVTGIGKMGVIQKLKEIKDKKRDSNASHKAAKHKAENGEIANNKLLANEDSSNEFGSDTSGISDTKLSFSEETIPLTTFSQSKSYYDDEEDNEDTRSDSSANCETAAKVPLVCVNSDATAAKHNNNDNSVKV